MTTDRVECRRCGRTISVYAGWCSNACWDLADACSNHGPQTEEFLTCESPRGHEGLHSQGAGPDEVLWSSRAKGGK